MLRLWRPQPTFKGIDSVTTEAESTQTTVVADSAAEADRWITYLHKHVIHVLI